MRSHRIAGKIELHVGTALAAFAVIRQFQITDISNKIGTQEEPAKEFTFSSEVVFGAGIKTITEHVIVIEYEINTMKQIHHETIIRYRVIPHRFAPSIEMLVVCV